MLFAQPSKGEKSTKKEQRRENKGGTKEGNRKREAMQQKPRENRTKNSGETKGKHGEEQRGSQGQHKAHMVIIQYYYIAIAYQRHMSNEIQRMHQLTQENLAY